MTSDSDDPLEGAAVGETRTVTHEETFLGVDFEPREFWGTDRVSDASIQEVEIIEHDDRADDLRVVWEGEVTKTLPRNWDDVSQTPPTASEKTARRLARYASKLIPVVVVAGAFALAMNITNAVFEGADISVNGEPIVPAPEPSIWITVALFGLLGWIIIYAVSGGLPRPTGGNRR